MKRQKRLNERTIERARKEKEKILMLEEKIKKAQEEIERIREENSWMHYLGSDFCEDATEEQQIEFFNNFSKIK